MSLGRTISATPAIARALWASGHGCLSETSVTPLICKVLNYSRMHAHHARKVRPTLGAPRPVLFSSHDIEFSATVLTFPAAAALIDQMHQYVQI